MTEPQKQDIVDKIIENTNVPVKPKPMVSNYYYVMSQLRNFYCVKLLRNSYIYFHFAQTIALRCNSRNHRPLRNDFSEVLRNTFFSREQSSSNLLNDQNP